MSRRWRKRGGGERFIKLPHWMLKSPAFRTLSPNGKAVLLHLWERHNGINNGDIEYAVREAADIGLSKDQAARALQELGERGFLRLTRDSAFRVKTKEARTWALTAEAVGGERATKDFMHWVPRSHQCDRAASGKFKTRSHQRDAQSHQRDSKSPNETKLPASVAPARPSDPRIGSPLSHQCDTYNIPWGVPQKRAPSPAKARGGVTTNESNDAARVKRRDPAASYHFDELEDDDGELTRLGNVVGLLLNKIEADGCA